MFSPGLSRTGFRPKLDTAIVKFFFRNSDWIGPGANLSRHPSWPCWMIVTKVLRDAAENRLILVGPINLRNIDVLTLTLMVNVKQ
jgi:hypothetical protein